jgi:hypothetical protein
VPLTCSSCPWAVYPIELLILAVFSIYFLGADWIDIGCSRRRVLSGFYLFQTMACWILVGNPDDKTADFDLDSDPIALSKTMENLIGFYHNCGSFMFRFTEDDAIQ